MDNIRPEYKLVKELKPFCPICKERLSGENSIILPYKCSCGIWKQDYETLAFTITTN